MNSFRNPSALFLDVYSKKRFFTAWAALCSLALFASLLVDTPAEAAYPGTNGKIAFVEIQGTGYGDIYTANADGSGRLKLPGNSTSHDVNPAFSPDGTKIAFESSRDGDNEIYVMNADGTGVKRLTNAVGSDAGPSWSPDGTKIVFSSGRDGQEVELYTVPAAGGTNTRLTNTPDDSEYYPAWSPDGSKIAYQNSGTTGIHIYAIPATGGTPTPLTEGPTPTSTPNWSPDGASIAFQRELEVWVMGADGSNPHMVANNGRITDPAYSPDGTKIVYASDAIDGSNDDIWAIPAAGGTPERVTTDPLDEWQPDWGVQSTGGGVPKGGRTIAGRVTKTPGFEPRSQAVTEPIVGASVQLIRSPSSATVLEETTTDADGYYQLESVPRCGTQHSPCFLRVTLGGNVIALRDQVVPTIPTNVMVNDIEAYEQEDGYRTPVEGTITAPEAGWDRDYELTVQLYSSNGTLLSQQACPQTGPAATFCLAPEPGPLEGDLVYRYLGIRPHFRATGELARAVLLQDDIAVDTAALKARGVIWKMEPLHAVRS